jgi:hypothetical protein
VSAYRISLGEVSQPLEAASTNLSGAAFQTLSGGLSNIKISASSVHLWWRRLKTPEEALQTFRSRVPQRAASHRVPWPLFRPLRESSILNLAASQPSQGRHSSPTGWPPSPSRAIAPARRPHRPSLRWPCNLCGSPRNPPCNH